MAAWQIIGYIFFAMLAGVVIYGMFDTYPKVRYTIPEYEDDEC